MEVTSRKLYSLHVEGVSVSLSLVEHSLCTKPVEGLPSCLVKQLEMPSLEAQLHEVLGSPREDIDPRKIED
eukprot:1158310-Pelagomonas_calceolata.AAC.4